MKDKILNMLKQNHDYISGEEMSQSLGVSRAAVWKVIKQIEQDGYRIDSKTRKGYRLVSAPDILFSSELTNFLDTQLLAHEIHHVMNSSSTSDIARQMAEQRNDEGYVVISENQFKGRGHGDSSWVSPKGKGIYMSVVLKPSIPMIHVHHITLLTTHAVQQALVNMTGLSFDIDWPSDILYQGKKLCGILTEASGTVEKLAYIVMGIGINVNLEEEDLSGSLAQSATSLKVITGQTVARKQLLSTVLNCLDQKYCQYKDQGISQILEQYKHSCTTMGQTIAPYGSCVDLGSNGQLVLLQDNGSKNEYYPGELPSKI